MDTDKIIQDLNRRFAAPLPEFYQRRIIFWYDEDKEFEDKLDEVVLENAKVIALTGNNAFSVKKMLSVDDLTTNYLVYSPCVYNRPDDNWLLDVELYSEEFRADLISIWMDEMGLISNPAMRKQVKNYRAYFNAKDRRLKVSTQNKVPETPAQLHVAVMAAICGLKDSQPNMILRSVFQAGLDLNNNTVYQDFVKYHADAAFWVMVRQGCGFVEEEPDLGRLAIHLLLTAATRTMRQEYLAGLDGFISMPHQAYCYDFISEWLHSDNIPQLYDVARYVEDEARLHQRFEKLAVEDLVGTECFPCINEVILTKLMTEISDHIIDVDTITNTVEKGELVYGMSHLRIFMTVSYKWRICKVSLRNILPDSMPQKRKVSGKNILRATIKWTLIIVCSILVFKRVWRLPIFCWMICSSMLSIRWKDFIRTGS